LICLLLAFLPIASSGLSPFGSVLVCSSFSHVFFFVPGQWQLPAVNNTGILVISGPTLVSGAFNQTATGTLELSASEWASSLLFYPSLLRCQSLTNVLAIDSVLAVTGCASLAGNLILSLNSSQPSQSSVRTLFIFARAR
jgi:hypothetical protein